MDDATPTRWWTLAATSSPAPRFASLDLSSLHALLLVSGRACDAFLVTKLLNLYSRLGDLPSVVLTFRHAPVKTSITWNSMIACYAHHGFLKDALA
ncbi:hypothetical protein ZIOFF_056376 [Zingiber officinale]|uniref:Pentatricopeptide repeat-containing protein n=1 Tax=Zingiber officinale TaxID=94328 RepID=A0A8J5KFC7_ZINOF|nr:hypothetical protein ZIOFF_056376 [Zingiber officinale]